MFHMQVGGGGDYKDEKLSILNDMWCSLTMQVFCLAYLRNSC